MSEFSIIIGNLERGFRSIFGFKTEEHAHNFVADNKHLVGQEYRVVEATHHEDVELNPSDAVAQDSLKFEQPKPGEIVDKTTGASIDTQDHSDKDTAKNADESAGGQDQGGTAEAGPGNSGDNSPLPDLSGTGQPAHGDGEGSSSDAGNAGAGDGASGEGALTNGL